MHRSGVGFIVFVEIADGEPEVRAEPFILDEGPFTVRRINIELKHGYPSSSSVLVSDENTRTVTKVISITNGSHRMEIKAACNMLLKGLR
jgi:hypothetical protein